MLAAKMEAAENDDDSVTSNINNSNNPSNPNNPGE